MPTRELLSESQRVLLTALPETGPRELARHHTLSDADLAAVGVRHGTANRLGFAVQLSASSGTPAGPCGLER